MVKPRGTRSQKRGRDETPTPGDPTLTTQARPATKKTRRAATQTPVFPGLGRQRRGAGLETIPEDEDDEIDIHGVPPTAPDAADRNVRRLLSEVNRYSNHQKGPRVKKRDDSARVPSICDGPHGGAEGVGPLFREMASFEAKECNALPFDGTLGSLAIHLREGNVASRFSADELDDVKRRMEDRYATIQRLEIPSSRVYFDTKKLMLCWEGMESDLVTACREGRLSGLQARPIPTAPPSDCEGGHTERVPLVEEVEEDEMPGLLLHADRDALLGALRVVDPQEPGLGNIGGDVDV